MNLEEGLNLNYSKNMPALIHEDPPYIADNRKIFPIKSAKKVVREEFLISEILNEKISKSCCEVMTNIKRHLILSIQMNPV